MSKNILGIFDGYDIEGITALVESLEQSSFDYLKLEGGGIAITIGKNGAGEAPVTVAQAAAHDAVRSAPISEPQFPPMALSPDAYLPETNSAVDVPEQEGVVVVKSPSYGLFYAQPEPGSPPYVKLGDTVKEGDTIGLVEIMKTFTAITSPVGGEIVGIHVKNEELLDPDQPLVSIKQK